MLKRFPQARPRLLLCAALVLGTLSAAYAQTQNAAAASAAQTRAVQVADTAFVRGSAFPAWAEDRPLPTSTLQAPYVQRLWEVNFHLGQETAIFARRAAQVSDPSALAALGQTEISFHPEYQRLELHRLRILRGSEVLDKLPKADIRFLQRETTLDQGIYSGAVTAAIVTDDVRVGDTLELAYTVTGSNPVFGGKFFDSAFMESGAPIGLRMVTVDAPEDRPVFYEILGGNKKGLPSIRDEHRNGRRHLQIQARDVPAVLPEQYLPSNLQAQRWLQLSEFAQWSDVNQWALGLFSAPANSPAIDEALKSARAAPNQRAAVAKVLEFVQKEIRYLSISVGENSHRPYPPEQVLARRYGDCKDKTLLMVSMLRRLGVRADPVLVPTYLKQAVPGMLPSPQLFDHAIVHAVVDGKEYFFDPTRLSQYGELDKMGQVHAGKEVLVVANGTTALTKIPVPADALLLHNSRKEKVTVAAMDQPVQMQVTLEYHGSGAESMREAAASNTPEQLRKFYAEDMGKRYPEAELPAAPAITDDRQNNAVKVVLNYRIAHFFDREGDASGNGGNGSTAGVTWQLRYKPTNLAESFFVPSLAKRDFPLAVPSYPGNRHYELEMTLPEQYDVKRTPSDLKLHNSAFDVTETLRFAGRVANVKVDLQFNADRIAAQDTPAFLTDIRKLNEIMGRSVPIRPGDLKTAANAASGQPAANTVTPAAVPPPPPMAYKQRVRQQLEQLIQSTSKAAADAEAAGRDSSASLCELALARSYLGQTAQAQDDIGKAVAQQPLPENLRCRGFVNFANGNFKASDSDLQRALAQGLDDSALHWRKGIADYYLNQLPRAHEEFLQASSKADNAADKLRMGIWAAIAMPDGAADLGADGSSGGDAWLGAALAMFDKRQSPEDVLRLAHQNAGSSLDLRLSEAYFYVGKYYLAQQNKALAKAYFQQALDKGALHSPYYIVARQELARMRGQAKP